MSHPPTQAELDASVLVANIERLVPILERNRTLADVDRVERMLRFSRLKVHHFPNVKARWSECCRRTAVVRDSLTD